MGLLTALLIVAACLVLLICGALLLFMLSAATANVVFVLALLSLPVTVIALIVVAVVADPGWSSVLLASVPLILGLVSAMIPSPGTGWSLFRPNGVSRRARRARQGSAAHKDR